MLSVVVVLVYIFYDVGLFVGCFNVVWGVLVKVLEYLIMLFKVCKILFIGLIFVGKYFVVMVGVYMKCVMMELGGYFFVLVFDDVDIDKVVILLVGYKGLNVG